MKQLAKSPTTPRRVASSAPAPRTSSATNSVYVGVHQGNWRSQTPQIPKNRRLKSDEREKEKEESKDNDHRSARSSKNSSDSTVSIGACRLFVARANDTDLLRSRVFDPVLIEDEGECLRDKADAGKDKGSVQTVHKTTSNPCLSTIDADKAYREFCDKVGESATLRAYRKAGVSSESAAPIKQSQLLAVQKIVDEIARVHQFYKVCCDTIGEPATKALFSKETASMAQPERINQKQIGNIARTVEAIAATKGLYQFCCDRVGKMFAEDAFSIASAAKDMPLTKVQVKTILNVIARETAFNYRENLERAQTILKRKFEEESDVNKLYLSLNDIFLARKAPIASSLQSCIFRSLKADPKMWHAHLSERDIEKMVASRIAWHLDRLEMLETNRLPQAAKHSVTDRFKGEPIYFYEYRRIPELLTGVRNGTTPYERVIEDYDDFLAGCKDLGIDHRSILQRFPVTPKDAESLREEIDQLQVRWGKVVESYRRLQHDRKELDLSELDFSEKLKVVHAEEMAKCLFEDFQVVLSRLQTHQENIDSMLKEHPLHLNAILRTRIRFYTTAEFIISHKLEKEEDSARRAQLQRVKDKFTNQRSILESIVDGKLSAEALELSPEKEGILDLDTEAARVNVTDSLDQYVEAILKDLEAAGAGVESKELFIEIYKRTLNKSGWERIQGTSYLDIDTDLSEYTSIITPAGIDPSLAGAYRADKIAGSGSESTAAPHAPNLAVAELFKEKRLISKQIRSGNTLGRGITLKSLKRGDSLEVLGLIRRLESEIIQVVEEKLGQESVEAAKKRLGLLDSGSFSPEKLTEVDAMVVREAVTRKRTNELITLAIQHAKDSVVKRVAQGEIPDVDFFSMNLQTANHSINKEREMIEEQTKALKALEGKEFPVQWNEDGKIIEGHVRLSRVVVANIPVNGVGYAGPGSLARTMTEQAVRDLVGSLEQGDKIEGIVGTFLANSPDISKQDRREIYQLVYQIRECMAAESFYGPEKERDVYFLSTRLLRLGEKVMDLPPHFNCKSGKDRTGMQDLENRLLAARIDVSGDVPRQGQLSEAMKATASRLYASSGNAKLQEFSTGVGGNKASQAYVRERFLDGFVDFYLGGSEMIKPGHNGTKEKLKKQLKRWWDGTAKKKTRNEKEKKGV